MYIDSGYLGTLSTGFGPDHLVTTFIMSVFWKLYWMINVNTLYWCHQGCLDEFHVELYVLLDIFSPSVESASY